MSGPGGDRGRGGSVPTSCRSSAPSETLPPVPANAGELGARRREAARDLGDLPDAELERPIDDRRRPQDGLNRARPGQSACRLAPAG